MVSTLIILRPPFLYDYPASYSTILTLYHGPSNIKQDDDQNCNISPNIPLLCSKSNQHQILAALLSALAAVSAIPTTSSSSSYCVTAIGIPSLDPACAPAKAENTNAAPSPMFLFSAGNYCANFSGTFASITVLEDSIPVGKECTIYAFTGPDCSGSSVESAVSGGCFPISATPSSVSAKLVCQ